MWATCASCTLCEKDPNYTEIRPSKFKYPTPLIWGPPDAPVLIIGDAWRWGAMRVLDEELDAMYPEEQAEILGDPQKFGQFIFQHTLYPKLVTALGKAGASKVAYTPAARCSFMNDPEQSSIARCSVYTKGLIEGRAMLVVQSQAHGQLGMKMDFESGTMIQHDRLGVVLMTEKLFKLFDDPSLISKLQRGMKLLRLL